MNCSRVRTFCSHHIGFLQVSVDAASLMLGSSRSGSVFFSRERINCSRLKKTLPDFTRPDINALSERLEL